MITHLVIVITVDSCLWIYVKELHSWNRDAVGSYFCDIPHAEELLPHCRIQIGYCVGYSWCWYARMVFSNTVKLLLDIFYLFFMYQCICNDVNKLWSLCQCLYIICTTLGSGVAHTNLKESFANNQNWIRTWHKFKGLAGRNYSFGNGAHKFQFW